MSRIDVRTKPLARQPRRWTAGGSEGVTGRAKARTCLKIVGFNPMRDRSFRDVRQAHQPAAPAHDRRHDGAPIQGEGAERLRPARQELHGLLGRSPATATSEDLRRYQLHLAKQQISPGSINAAIAALRFFFTVMLERPDLVRPLTIVNKPRKAPVVLSEEEVARLLEAAPNLKYKAALSVAYGAGLRVSEVANLKVSDIDSQRMTLRVEQGKGQRDRYVMLSPQLLELLRDWWWASRPRAWLFPGQNPVNPMSARQLRRIVYAAAQVTGITKRVSPHTLRHSFAPHLLEQNVDIRVIQVLLGHAKLETTALYTRVAVNTIRDVTSPLDRLGVNLARRPPPARRWRGPRVTARGSPTSFALMARRGAEPTRATSASAS